MVVTKHAKERTKNRVGLRKGLAEKNAEKALEYGLSHADTTGGLKRYIDYLYLTHGFGEIRIYHRYVYIFCNGKLVTILPLPNKYNELADKLQRGKSETMKQERKCVSCGNNIRSESTDGSGHICNCAVDGHYIGYVESFEHCCKRWVKTRRFDKQTGTEVIASEP